MEKILLCTSNNVKNVIQLFNRPIPVESFVLKLVPLRGQTENERIFIIKINQDASAATRKYFARLLVKQKNSARARVWGNSHEETDVK